MKSIKSDGCLEWDVLHSTGGDLWADGTFFCPTFVISGVSETRAGRGGRVFTRPEAAERDAGQAYPPESKTNIRQVAESLSLWLCRFKWMVVGRVGCSSHITLTAKALIFPWTLNPSCGNRSGNQVKSRHLCFFFSSLHYGWSDRHVKAGLPSVPWATEILQLKQEWLASKSRKNTSVIFPQWLAGHLFGHQEMSECFCSYFRK